MVGVSPGIAAYDAAVTLDALPGAVPADRPGFRR